MMTYVIINARAKDSETIIYFTRLRVAFIVDARLLQLLYLIW